MAPFLYHGTSTGYLDQILRDGLDPRSSYKNYLCFSDELECASWFAQCMAEWDSDNLDRECEAIVFKLQIDRFDPASFCVEENFIQYGPVHCRGTQHAAKIKANPNWTWQELYELSGAVGYRKLFAVTKADIIKPLSVEE